MNILMTVGLWLTILLLLFAFYVLFSIFKHNKSHVIAINAALKNHDKLVIKCEKLTDVLECAKLMKEEILEQYGQIAPSGFCNLKLELDAYEHWEASQ